MKIITKCFLLLSLTSVITSTSLSYAQDIGQGYSCNNSKILRKGKEVKLSKAKEAIQNKIDAVSGNNAKAKEKKATLKAIKANLTKCTKGTFSGGSGPNADEKTLVGTYSGNLSFVSVTSSGQGCEEDATTFWRFYIGQPDGGKVAFVAQTPFGGTADEGGAVGTTGFKYLTNEGQPFSLSRYYEATGSNLTQSTVSITVVQSVLKQGNLVCKSTYTGEMSRNPTDPYEN